MVVGQLLITPTVEICIQQLGRVEEMIWLSYNTTMNIRHALSLCVARVCQRQRRLLSDSHYLPLARFCTNLCNQRNWRLSAVIYLHSSRTYCRPAIRRSAHKFCAPRFSPHDRNCDNVDAHVHGATISGNIGTFRRPWIDLCCFVSGD